jgi:hypothetical protein
MLGTARLPTPIRREPISKGRLRFTLPRRPFGSSHAPVALLTIIVLFLLGATSIWWGFALWLTIVLWGIPSALMLYWLAKHEIEISNGNVAVRSAVWRIGMQKRWKCDVIDKLVLMPHQPRIRGLRTEDGDPRRDRAHDTKDDRVFGAVADLVAYKTDEQEYVIASGYPVQWLAPLADELAAAINAQRTSDTKMLMVRIEDAYGWAEATHPNNVKWPARSDWEIDYTSGRIEVRVPRPTLNREVRSINRLNALLVGAGAAFAIPMAGVLVHGSAAIWMYPLFLAVPLFMLGCGILGFIGANRLSRRAFALCLNEHTLEILDDMRDEPGSVIPFASIYGAACAMSSWQVPKDLIRGIYEPLRELHIFLESGRMLRLATGQREDDIEWLADQIRLKLQELRPLQPCPDKP